MRFRTCAACCILFLAATEIRADGFKLRLEGEKILAKNNVGVSTDNLFGHALDVINNVDGTFESSHGSIDANDAGSGFNFPGGSGNDSFTYEVLGLWTYDGNGAISAPDNAALQILKPPRARSCRRSTSPLRRLERLLSPPPRPMS